MQKRAKAISEKAKSPTLGSKGETKFENERLVKSLHVGGQVPTNLSEALTVAHNLGKLIFDKTAAYGTELGQGMLDAMNSADGKIDSLSVKAYGGGLSPLSDADAKAAGFDSAPEGMQLVRSVELLGGKAVLGRYSAGEAKGAAAVNVLSQSSAALVAFSNKAGEVTKTEVATLESAEIGKTADVVALIAADIIAFRSKSDKANDMKTKILAAADKLSKAEVKEDDADKKAWMGAMQKLATNAGNVIDKPAPQVSQYLLVTGKAALDYCEESLKQYKTSAAK